MGKAFKRKKTLVKSQHFFKVENIDRSKNQFNQKDVDMSSNFEQTNASNSDFQQTITSDSNSQQSSQQAIVLDSSFQQANAADLSSANNIYCSSSQKAKVSGLSSQAANIPDSSSYNNSNVLMLIKYLGKDFVSHNSLYDENCYKNYVNSDDAFSNEMSSTLSNDIHYDNMDDKLENNFSSSDVVDSSKPVIFPIKEEKWIFILPHPTTVQLNYQANLRVLSGGITILGHEINPNSSSFDVFSFRKIMYLQITTKYAANITQNSSHSKILKDELNNLDEKLAPFIFNYCKDNSIVLLIQPLKTNLALKVLKLYVPSIFRYESKSFDNFGKEIISNDPYSDAINLSQNLIDKSLEIGISIIQNLKDSIASRVLIYGPKNCGKSTLARFLINHLLEKIEDICYLDCDIGQSEFTPSGCVSLTLVNKPLFGPPFTHLKSPIKMCCIANTNVDFNPGIYIKSIKHLMEIYLENYSSKVLFINTMGYVTGVGSEILCKLINIIKPTIMIELLPFRNYVLEFHFNADLKSTHHIIEVDTMPESMIKGKALRDLSALVYLSQRMHPLGRLDFESLIPLCKSMKTVGLYFAKRCLESEIVCESLLNVYVALCVVNEKYLPLYKTDVKPPKVFKELPMNECLGFGIVYSICEENYYVLTPISFDMMERCNLFIRCSMDSPNAIYTKRSARLDELPFVFPLPNNGLITRQKVKCRAGRFVKK